MGWKVSGRKGYGWAGRSEGECEFDRCDLFVFEEASARREPGYHRRWRDHSILVLIADFFLRILTRTFHCQPRAFILGRSPKPLTRSICVLRNADSEPSRVTQLKMRVVGSKCVALIAGGMDMPRYRLDLLTSEPSPAVDGGRASHCLVQSVSPLRALNWLERHCQRIFSSPILTSMLIFRLITLCEHQRRQILIA